MMRYLLAGCCMLLLGACGTSKKEVMQSAKDNNLVQEKTVNNYIFRLQYMPPEQKNDDTALLYFRLNVNNNGEVPVQGKDAINSSYGLDTLFSIVSATDTIHPVDINRIANGNIKGPEYMLVFDREKLHAIPDCRLIFRDWLFTQQLISFPLSGKAIAHIDSLSLNI